MICVEVEKELAEKIDEKHIFFFFNDQFNL